MKRALIVVALAGCTPLAQVTPDAAVTALPDFPAAQTARMEQNLAIDRWWKHFDDAVLDGLMDEALAKNADLESALGRVREAQASLDVVRAAQAPTVDLNARSSRDQRSNVSATPIPPGVGRQTSSHKLSFDAGYEADLWGRLSSSTKAARQQLLATQWARAAVEWGVTASVAETYFQLAAVDRQVVISESMRAGRARNVELRQRENTAGVGTEFDLRRAEAELTSAEATLAGLQRQRSSLERALALLTGRTPQQIAYLALERRMLDEATVFTPVLPQGAAGELLVRRPDIRQAEAQLAAANANIAAARAATLPALRLSGSVGSDARSMSDLFTGPAAIWSLAASVSQPLFDGGRLKAQVRQEEARAQQALAEYRKTVTTAVADVRDAYLALDLEQQAWASQKARAASLQRAMSLAQLGYDEGALGFLDYLDAERNWYQAQLDQVSAYRDGLVGQVAAFKALGGGYTTQGSTL
jgi:multidrug efflux system outer membrane protein